MSLERIESERLLLRPLRMDDAEAVHAWACDPYDTRFMSWPCHKDMDETRKVLAQFAEGWKDGAKGDYTLGLQLKSTGELVGSTGIGRSTEQFAECGWIVDSRHRGKGLAHEAVLALCATAFAEWGWLKGVTAGIHPLNHRSLALAVRLGFRPWGTRMGAYPQLGLKDFETLNYLLRRP